MRLRGNGMRFSVALFTTALRVRAEMPTITADPMSTIAMSTATQMFPQNIVTHIAKGSAADTTLACPT
jgi:hypothetical protein